MSAADRRDESATTEVGVRAVNRAVAILSAFTPTNPRLGLLELARAAGLSPSTTHRVLASLTQHQLVMQVTPGGDYSLGPAILRMAMAADRGMDIVWLARDTLIKLRDESGETSAVHVFKAPRFRVTLAQEEGVYPLRRSYTDIGESIPLNHGASSLALLANLPVGTVDETLSHRLDAATPHTLTDPDTIRRELDRIRKRGYALSTEGRLTGVCGVAAPVFDYASNVIAAISISGPRANLPESRLRSLGELVRSHAEELSEYMGYASHQPTDV